MNYKELNTVIGQIKGLRLESIGLACQMLMFYFGNYALHAQCLTRIIKSDDILLTTRDYQSWDEKHEENHDEIYNLKKYSSVIKGGKVTSVNITPCLDLTITLDNDITIQVIIENGYFHFGEENEQYRFFECSEDENKDENMPPHYVVYNKRIEI